MPIPKTVRHAELMNALQPLYDLLGVTARDIYANPPLTIGGPQGEYDHGTVRFAVVPGEPTGDFRPGIPASDDGESVAELMQYVMVEII